MSPLAYAIVVKIREPSGLNEASTIGFVKPFSVAVWFDEISALRSASAASPVGAAFAAWMARSKLNSGSTSSCVVEAAASSRDRATFRSRIAVLRCEMAIPDRMRDTVKAAATATTIPRCRRDAAWRATWT